MAVTLFRPAGTLTWPERLSPQTTTVPSSWEVNGLMRHFWKIL